MQQDVFRQWAQPWLSSSPSANGTGVPAEWGRNLQKRWTELLVETLNKHRESLDAAYRAGIQVIEQSSQVSEAKSSDDYRRAAEELWRKIYDLFKEQSEAQIREFQDLADKSFAVQKATA